MMPRRDPRNDDQLAQLTAFIARSGCQGRERLSPLSKWLMARHDAFASILCEYPASWTAIADALAAIGVTDGKGNAPTAERVRKTWWDARQRVSAQRAQTSADTSTTGTGRDHAWRPLRSGSMNARRGLVRAWISGLHCPVTQSHLSDHITIGCAACPRASTPGFAGS